MRCDLEYALLPQPGLHTTCNATPCPIVISTAMAETTLAGLDAVETAARIGRGDVAITEVIAGAIARARDVAHLGAIVTESFDRTPDVATAPGPLAGVPTFIKDLAHLEGVRTTWGSRGSGEYVSRKSDPLVSRLQRAGMICLGKSATPELGLTATTEPLGREPCRNPWDPTRSAGGSSGGAAALVAAGVVPIAHASDGGGSIRIPAACCGVVGLKPSRRVLDMPGSRMLPINIATEGVITRTVRDQIAFYDAIAPKRIGPAFEPRALRIAAFVDAPTTAPVHADTRAAVLSAAKLCEALGHKVEQIPCPFEARVIDDFLQYWSLVAWLQVKFARFTLHRRFDATQLEPWTSGMAATFAARRRATFAAIRRLRAFERTYARFFESYDVLVSPTTAEPAPLLGHLATDQPFETKWDRLRNYVPFTPIQNVAGAPAITLPLGRSGSGLPIGVMFAGARGADRMLLELAQTIEVVQPWPGAAPRERWARSL